MTSAANPFDILPANLFNLFSTQGSANLSRHYMALLLRVYTLAEFNRFGLSREVVLSEILDYLKTEGVTGEVAAEMAVQEDPDPEQNGADARPAGRKAGQKTEADTAAYLLRRLAETGWIEREQHADYSETIILPDYAFTLLEAFRSIQEQKPREFTGQLYTAFQLITSAASGKDASPALAVTQAYENVRQVVRGLSELNQNIRRYIERATRGREVAEILQLQFDNYSATLGPTYHALKTSDHISRYRRDIVGHLQSWQVDTAWLERAAEDLAAQGRFSPAQAEQELDRILQFVVHQLEALDPLLEDIDRRHAQYWRTSLRQVRYRLAGADGGFKDRLVSLARGLADLKDQGQSELPDDAPGLQQHPVHEPDSHSFYTPPQRRAPFVTATIAAPALHPADLAALRTATLRDVSQALTPGKVNRYVLGFFNGHRKIHVRDLPPDLLDDLHWLTTILAYAHHPEVAYGVTLAEGEPVEVGPYRVIPFELERLG